MTLVPCAACDRHRFATDEACPFCGSVAVVLPESRVVARATRAALVFGGAALVAGCVGKALPYGAPPDRRVDAGEAMEAPVPAYGAPPPVTQDGGATTEPPAPPPAGK